MLTSSPRGSRRLLWSVRIALPLFVLLGAMNSSVENTSRDAAVTWLSDTKRSAFEPAACVDANQRLWALWGSHPVAGHSAPRLEGTVVEHGEVLKRFVIAQPGNLPAAPQIVPYRQGAYCVWETGSDEDRALVGLFLEWTGNAVVQGKLETIKTSATALVSPSLVSHDDVLEVVFQGLNGATYDLFHATYQEREWSLATPLLETEVDEWNPRAVVDGSGRVHVVWDYYTGESYDVAYAQIEEGALAGRIELAAGPDYQGYPEISVNPRGSDEAIWVTWESADQFGESGALRGARSVNLVRLSDEGLEVFDSSALPTRRRQFPRPFVTDDGLLLASRVALRSERQRHRVFSSWVTSTLSFEGESHSESTLDATDGDNRADFTLVDGGDEVWMVFASDGRRRNGFPGVDHWEDSIEGSWQIGLSRIDAPTGFPKLKRAGPPVAQTTKPVLLEKRADSSPGVFFGDLHRHTHLSRCSGGRDGTLLDAYRYARGPGGLDFLAVTDHYQHLRPWSWWRSVRDVVRYNAPGSLVLFAGVERTATGRGHFNDIYLRSSDVPFSAKTWERAPSRFAPVSSDEVISIPHMMGVDTNARFNWDEYDPDRTRLFEVYQGQRGSYEGAGLPYENPDGVDRESSIANGIERGAHFGLIASSDHVSARSAFAGVFAEQLSRRSIFQALRDRHTFAATEQRVVSSRLGRLMMGELGDPGDDPSLTLQFSETAAKNVAYIEVVINGELERRLAGAGSTERWIASLTKGEELSVEVAGGRLTAALPRRLGEGRVELASSSESAVSFRKVGSAPAHVALSIDWSENGALQLEGGGRKVRVLRESLAFGRSRSLKFPKSSGQLWRQGPALGNVEKQLMIDNLSVQPGDCIYVRVAWTDGEIAWTSPITVKLKDF